LSSSYQLVASDADLVAVLARHAGAEAVAVDTEFMRRNTFFPQVALLQLGFKDGVYLIDPKAIEDTSPIANLFRDNALTKVLHSVSEDLEVFAVWLQTQPRPLFDTQRAAALLNEGFGLGYRALVEADCGVVLDKGETRSDWLARPLTASQCEYAAQDVAYLLPIYERQRADAEQAGKLGWILEDGATAVAQAGAAAEDYSRRVKSAWTLDRRQLAALQAVCDWREESAVSRDKPRSWIVDDKACLAIAQSLPRDEQELASVSGLPPKQARRLAEPLLAAVDTARSLPESELPERLPGPLTPRQRQQLKRLKAAARALAEELDVAPEVLLASRDYELLLRESAGESIAAPLAWDGWRADRVIAPLREYLARGADD
jgi:ribonuclease D